jgi:hypothetical protein
MVYHKPPAALFISFRAKLDKTADTEARQLHYDRYQ